MYYHTCVIHLFRPFLKVSFVQSTKTPRQICTEKAHLISRLMDRYVRTYGIKPSIFIQAHCIMSAGIIHLVDISSTPTATNSAATEQSEIFLATSIRQLSSIKSTYLLVARYAQALVGLTYKWCNVVPRGVQEAIAEAGVVLPDTSSNSPAQHKPYQNLVNATGNGFHKPETPVIGNPHIPQFIERKHSAPDLVSMAPNSQPHSVYSLAQSNHSNHRPFHPTPSTPAAHSINPSCQDQLFWTPFPGTFDGIPLPMPDIPNHHVTVGTDMSVTAMLGGQFPRLSQDGFMVVEHDSVAGGESGTFWGNWEGGHGI